MNFPLSQSYVKLSSAVGAILVEGPNRRTHFGREPSNDYLIKILFLLSKWFQIRRFLWEFPLGSYVKLSLAVVTILVGVLKCRTQFWKKDHPRIISAKPSSFRGGLFLISSPLFSNLHNRSKSTKVQSS